MYRLFSGLCTLIAAFSGLIVVSAIGDLVQGSDTSSGILMGLVVFFGLTGIASGRYVFKTRIGVKRKIEEKKERKLLNIIRKKSGRITPFELASESDFSFDEAKNALEQLCIRGVGQAHITDEGYTVYVFDGVVSDDQKLKAKSPLKS